MDSRDRDQTPDDEDHDDPDDNDDDGDGESPPESPRDPLRFAGTLFAIDAGVEVIRSGIALRWSPPLDWLGVLLTSIEVVVAIGLLRTGSKFRWPGVLLMLTFLGNSLYLAWVPDAEPSVSPRLVIVLMGLLGTLPFALLLLGRPSLRNIRIAIGVFVASMLVSVAASVLFVVLAGTLEGM